MSTIYIEYVKYDGLEDRPRAEIELRKWRDALNLEGYEEEWGELRDGDKTHLYLKLRCLRGGT